MMITCHTTRRILDLSFADYLQLPQYSHSYLKSEKGGFVTSRAPSAKMQLGSLVDGILTNGDGINMLDPLYPAAKNIAATLKAEFGSIITCLHKQVSYTSIMQYDAGRAVFELPVKGRPDFEEPGKFIIDLKVTDEIDVDNVIRHFGYPNQQFGYCKQAGCKVAYLLFYRKKKKDTVLRSIPIGDTNAWWQEKIIKFGKAV